MKQQLPPLAHAIFAIAFAAIFGVSIYAAEDVRPSASLLLPRFEISLDSQQPVPWNTTFTVVNHGDLPQPLRITYLSDRGFPIMWYPTVLAPHDQQTIDVAKVVFNGIFEERPGDSSCAANSGLTNLPIYFVAKLRCILTIGSSFGECTKRVGERHAHAIGYITIDIVKDCSVSDKPSLIDAKVLSGSYEQRAAGRAVAAGPLLDPARLPAATTLHLPRGDWDVYVWRAPTTLSNPEPLMAGCDAAAGLDRPLVETIHVKRWRPSTMTIAGRTPGQRVWATVAKRSPLDANAQSPPDHCGPEPTAGEVIPVPLAKP